MKSRERFVLRMGVLVVVVTGSIKLTVRVRDALGAQRRDLTASVERLAAAERQVRRLPGLEDSAAAVRGELIALASRILKSRSEADATAELAGILPVIAARAGATVEGSTASSDSARAGTLHRVSMQFQVATDGFGMNAILTGLVSNLPTLELRRLRIAVGNGDRFNVQLVVAGWYRESP
ncbi:MAG: hypothetical protein IT352_08385 [Gemmatimonadales bacterium]|nr:hypothetical protein [Gemmatimonadales bacterium]